ncbi:MAG: hypothetical protein ACD_29C00330G0001 [uncultured bacterium]|nr:MAG: hypothetical protein ACD_29C00330G0001 [uncultured bacterium]
MRIQSIVPVITIDGVSGSGKGTIAQMLAKKLKWHYLDSGALYRAFAWGMINAKINPENHDAVTALIPHIHVEMRIAERGEIAEIFYDNQDITKEIRSEICGQMASKCSAIPFVRQALLNQQRAFKQSPGLVTDGRDMGSAVFPDASVKFYFDASVKVRAKRRYNQLKQQGKDVSLCDVEMELKERDERDASRSASPLRPMKDAIILDTGNSSVEAVFEIVLQHVKQFI